MEYWIFWILVIFILTFIEVITVNLMTIWFVASAIVAMIISFFISSFYIQFMVFGVGGIVLLITTRPLLKKVFDKDLEKTNLDLLIGMKAMVTEAIKKDKIGEVKVDGKKWSAIALEDISEGENVIIEKIIGVKLVVRKENK